MVGGSGANMVYWIDKDGKTITDSAGQPILLRDVHSYLRDASGKNIADSTNHIMLVNK